MDSNTSHIQFDDFTKDPLLMPIKRKKKKKNCKPLSMPPNGYLKDISTLLFATFFLGDIILFIIFLHSLFTYCDQPLQWWCLGSVLLSTPLSLVFEPISRRQSYDRSMELQLYFFIVSLVWLGFGTYWVNTCHFCPITSPLMWWTVFVVVTFSWCCIVGIIVTILAFTILSTINPSIWLSLQDKSEKIPSETLSS